MTTPREREVYDDEVEDELEQMFRGLSKLQGEQRRSVVRHFRRSMDSGEAVLPPPPTPQQETKAMGDKGEDSVVSMIKTVALDNTTRKIKNFSGSKSLAPGEVNFIRWKRSALQIACDPELTANRKKVLVLQSITGEAEDSIQLVRDKTASEIITFLESIYGRVEDSHDMMAEFYQLVQQTGQSASEYASTLYRRLSEMVGSKVVKEEELKHLLLRQFSRGLRDESVVVGLRLDDLIEEPPDFTELVKRVRAFETRSAARQARTVKPVRSQEVKAEVSSERRDTDRSKEDRESAELEEVRDRLSQLETAAMAAQEGNKLQKFPSFCYRCGIEKHMAFSCDNPANKELVRLKQQQRRQFYENQKNVTSLRLGPKTRR